MHNICPNPDYSFTIAKRPRIVGPKGIQPLCVADSDSIIAFRSNHLLIINTASGAESPIATLPSTPLCAAVLADVIIVMTNDGPFRLTRSADGKWVPAGIFPGITAVSFAAHSAGSYSADIPAGNVDKLTDVYLAAYNDMAGRAAAAGLLVQPVLARYRLRDNAGRQLFLSQPVAVVPRAGAPLTEALTFNINYDNKDNAITDIAQLSLPAYSLQFSIADALDDVWADIVASLEIEITPQFHPIASGDAQLSYNREGTTVTLQHQGLMRRLNAANMAAAAARFDSLATTVAVVPYPFRTAMTRNISVASPGSALSQADSLAAALARDVANDTHVAVPLFSATHCAVTPGAVAWGGIKNIHNPAPSPADFALSTNNRRWSAVCKVTMANGDCCISNHSGSAAPETLSPLIAWPEAGVVQLDIALSIDGEASSKSLSLPMQTDPSGRISIHAATSAKPLSFTDTQIEIDPGDALASSVRNKCALAFASALDPLNPGVTTATTAPITALSPAFNSGGAWDFGHGRFYAFTDVGVFLAVSDKNVSSASVSPICGAAIAAPTAVTVGDDGRVFFLARGGNLMALSGSRVSLIDSDVPGDILIFSHYCRALISADSDDNIARIYPLWLQSEYQNLMLPEAFYSIDLTPLPSAITPQAAFIATADGLADLNAMVAPSEDVDACSLSFRIPWRKNAASLKRNGLLLPILTDHAKATVSISRAYASIYNNAVINSIALNGAFAAPLHIAPILINMPGAPVGNSDRIIISLNGTLAPNSIIHHPILS